MTRILASYGTSYGQTEKIVRRIAHGLRRHGLSVVVLKADQLDPGFRLDEFDGFLVAASVLRGHHQRYVEDFVRQEAARLSAAPSAFVSVSGSAGSPGLQNQLRAREYLEEFFQLTGWRPSLRACFGGCTAYTKYGFLLRWITMLVSKWNGGPTDMTRDHESTDWEAVDRFASELSRLAQPRPS